MRLELPSGPDAGHVQLGQPRGREQRLGDETARWAHLRVGALVRRYACACSQVYVREELGLLLRDVLSSAEKWLQVTGGIPVPASDRE